MPGPEDTPLPDTPTPGGPDDPSNPDNLTPTTPTTPGEEETVTIDDGDRSISVSSPDGQGQVTVTVDDGSGEPKTYTLDFGEGTGTETPGAPGTPVGSAAPGTPGAEGRPGAAFGPEGMGGNQPPTLDEPIQPGPDGRCVIEDGDLTITAERPEGSTDTVVVTVDDGSGEPVTYNLDYSGEDGPAATPRPEARPLHVSGNLDEPTTMPAPGQPVGVAGSDPSGPGGLPDPRGQFATGTALPEPSAAQYGTGPGGLPDPAGQYATGTALPEPSGQYGSGPGGLPDPAGQYGATAAQSSLPGDDGSFFSDPNGNAGEAGSFGVPEQSQYAGTPSDDPGEAGLATASDDDTGTDGGHSQQQGNGQGMAGGMPMMGGAGGGSGAGGDQERAGSQWRTTGDLFDDVTDAQVRGAFGEGSR